MPTAAGPNTALDSNIVFSYDVGDTSNSYIGEPTTNLALFGMDGFFNTDYPSNCIFSNDTGKGYKGRDAKKVIAFPGQWNIYRYPRPGNYTATSSTVFTYSFKMKWADGHTPYFSNGYIYVDAVVTYPGITVIPIDDGWYLCYCTYSGTSSPPWLTGFSTSDYGTCWICDWQLEAKSYPTPYAGIGATRSATQGLLPLISNTTINLSNVSFTSNAQITYDGTDDHIDLGNLGTIGTTYSIECVFNSSNVVNYRNIFDMNYATYSGVTGNVGPRLEQYSDGTITVIWSGVTNNNSIAVNTPVTPISANTNYHMVFTQDGNKGSIYLNGAYKSQNSNTYGYIQTFGDANLGRGFELAGDRYFAGSLPLFKIYNQALSSDQVKQNYQQYKSRFNLS
jgi:hypothetical protein